MKINILLVCILLLLYACSNQNKSAATQNNSTLVQSSIKHVEWSENAVIYEVNIRQYTKEGTFEAFAKHIPRLKELGIDILWLMPIHPIGVKKRKGILGSYYSVRDYKGVNPEFGTMSDFKSLVKKAHENNMYVIIDWVANHTAWDHNWIKDNPGWYSKDSTGNFYGPFDWSDVAQLNYDEPALHDAMIDALEFWVKETDIDGYRCDVAGMVPRNFWDRARKSLDIIKPVFMLAEDEENHELLEDAFDMNYGWQMHHIMNKIAKGEKDVKSLEDFYAKEDSIYPKSCYRMQFITNHDENSWNGTEFVRLGEGVKTFAVMTFTIPGMPLLYTGQEFGMNKRLEFFEKDEVIYKENDFPEFYKSLIELKKNNKLFWNGDKGGEFEIVSSGNKNVFVFKRFNDENKVFIVLNLSGELQNFTLPGGFAGAYKNYFNKETSVLNEGEKMQLEAWEYKILNE